MVCPSSLRGCAPAGTQIANRHCAVTLLEVSPPRKESESRCRRRGQVRRRARISRPRASPEKTVQSRPYAGNRHTKIRPVKGWRQNQRPVRIDARGIQPVDEELAREHGTHRGRSLSPETRPHRISSRALSPHLHILTQSGSRIHFPDETSSAAER